MRELACFYLVKLSWSELTRDSPHRSTSIKREIPYLKGVGASKTTKASITPRTDITPTPNPTMSCTSASYSQLITASVRPPTTPSPELCHREMPQAGDTKRKIRYLKELQEPSKASWRGTTNRNRLHQVTT
ncbi:MAG: hypothetical protein ACK56F_04485, partial [bacterium]